MLGGGDGLAVREILKHPNVEHVTLVDLDPAMTGLFSRSEPLVKLNQGALKDPRVTVINDDAGRWLESHAEVYDYIVVDFPDPSNFGLGRLYSVPVYHLMARHLAENGYMVIQSTSPYFAPRSFWERGRHAQGSRPAHLALPRLRAVLRRLGLHPGRQAPRLHARGQDHRAGALPDSATLRELFHSPPTCPRWPCRRTA